MRRYCPSLQAACGVAGWKEDGGGRARCVEMGGKQVSCTRSRDKQIGRATRKRCSSRTTRQFVTDMMEFVVELAQMPQWGVSEQV